jgi:hypothetical protein
MFNQEFNLPEVLVKEEINALLIKQSVEARFDLHGKPVPFLKLENNIEDSDNDDLFSNAKVVNENENEKEEEIKLQQHVSDEEDIGMYLPEEMVR